MLPEHQKASITPTCAVQVTPSEVDAGADLTLTGEVSCSPPFDLLGQALEVRDQDGALIGTAEITEYDGEINKTDHLVTRAPVTTGEFTWVTVLPAGDADGQPFEEASAAVCFTVKPHRTSVAIWDVPSTIEAGESFHIKVGVKCSSECRPTGWAVEILDQSGTQLATTNLGDEPWPGTGSLHFAEVDLRAPMVCGLHKWKARAPGFGSELPHEERASEFGVRVVPQPEFLLRVEAIDQPSQAPIKGAKVVVHPYRALTDEFGVAELRVSKGDYTIFVSGRKHIPFRMVGAVTADMTIRAALAPDVGLTEADIWS